jgi:hypothetical protein
MKPISFVAGLIFAGACSAPAATTGSSVAELRAALPTRASLAITPVATQAAPAQTACAVLRPSSFGTLTHQIAGNTDGVLGGILGTVEQITSTPPALAEPGHAVWGPLSSPNGTTVYRLDVAATAPSEFHFVLSGKPTAGDDSAWRGLFQGVTVAPDADHRSGQVAIDFNVMHALDATTDPIAGAVGVHFDAAGAARHVTASFAGIAGKSAPQPDDAQYELALAADQSAGLGFTTRIDFDGDGALDELAHIDSRWAASGGGVAHLTVTGGSLGTGSVTAVECWDPSLGRVFYADSRSGSEGDATCCPQ